MATPLDPELVDQIRASLYAGRGVRLYGDDAPTTMLEPSTEMTPDGEAFFLGKLDKVAELLERGFVVNIDSQGSILAVTPDRQSRYISTQETDIDVMDRIMVKNAIEAGAKVSFEQDGSLVIDGHSSPTPPSAAHAAAQYAEFERLADSGDINAELAAGRDFVFDAASVPDPTPPVDDPFDTAAELEAEAASLQMGVDVARSLALPEFMEAKEAAEVARLAADRELAMAKAERDQAAAQAAAADAAAKEAAADAAAQRAEAAVLREQGKEAQADAMDADATSFEGIAEVHTRLAHSAKETLAAAEQRVQDQSAVAEQATADSKAVNARFGGMEEMHNEQDAQVWHARAAAAELAEAERLEAALPDLEARGVEGLERVHDAIAAHRAAAEQHVEAGHLRGDKATPIVVVGDELDAEPVADEGATTAPVPDDFDLIEIEIESPAPAETEPTETEPTEQTEASQPTEVVEVTEQTDAVWDGIDPALIEIDEPPAEDFSSDDSGSDGFGSVDGEMMDTDHDSIAEF